MVVRVGIVVIAESSLVYIIRNNPAHPERELLSPHLKAG
jgi:hypothetical protein